MRQWFYRLRDQFWCVPLLLATLAVAAAVGLTFLDDLVNSSFRAPFLFRGGPEGARSVLSSIIQSMISFTGLVFSITIVALQLTSSQFSPRILRTFLRDRFTQASLGTFIATFMYAIVVLRSVRGTSGDNPSVPQIAVTGSVLLVAVSTVVFIFYIHHTAQSMRIATIIARIGADTRRLIDAEYGDEDADHGADRAPSGPGADGRAGTDRPGPGCAQPRRIASSRHGVVQRIDDDGLVRLARREKVAVRLLRSTGEFVPAGAPLMDLLIGTDTAAELDADEFRGAVQFGHERSLDQDVLFGLRELVDIAEKALSPGINDPTTAVQAIDQMHELTRRLVTRRLVPRRRVDDDGTLLVEIPRPGVEEMLRLVLQEVMHWGGDVPRIRSRLALMLDDLLLAARPEYRAPIAAAARRYGLHQDDDFPSSPTRPTDIGLR